MRHTQRNNQASLADDSQANLASSPMTCWAARALKPLKRRYYLFRYAQWYRKNIERLKENPDEVRRMAIRFRWHATQTDDAALHFFADWMEGWLKERGQW